MLYHKANIPYSFPLDLKNYYDLSSYPYMKTQANTQTHSKVLQEMLFLATLEHHSGYKFTFPPYECYISMTNEVFNTHTKPQTLYKITHTRPMY